MRPNKLTENDEIRVIAPSRSLAIISQATRDITNKRRQSLGLTISSSSIEQRVKDLHDAFLDKT